MKQPPFLLLCAVNALLAVAMGAFGAHGLKNQLSATMMATYHTAVDYHMWHALGLGIISLLAQRYTASCLKWAGWSMFTGIVLFSGSLYVLAITDLKWLGMITPFGGMAFLIGWALLIVFAMKQQTLSPKDNFQNDA